MAQRRQQRDSRVQDQHEVPQATRKGTRPRRTETLHLFRLYVRGADSRPAGSPPMLTRAQADVVARLLDELAGVYKDEDLGKLAGELSRMLDSKLGGQA